MRNPLWAPEYTGLKPSFNDMGALRLNPWHPLSDRLAIWFLLNAGAGKTLFDLMTRTTLDIETASSVWMKGDRGAGLTYQDGGLEYYAYKDPYAPIVTSDGAGTGDFTMMVVAAPPAEAAMHSMLSQTSTTNQLYLIANCKAGYSSESGTLFFGSYSSAEASVTIAGAIDGKTHTFVAVRAGTTHIVYRDYTFASATKTVQDILGGVQGFSLGGIKGYGSTYENAGPLYEAAAWNRALTQEEVFELIAHPYGTPDNPRFIVEPQRTWFVPRAGSESASESLSPSATPSPSESKSLSASESASESFSISPSLSASISSTPSFSESPSLSSSPSSTESLSESLSVSGSFSASLSSSESPSKSFSISSSLSPSESLSESASFSASLSGSESLSPSSTPSFSESPSESLSISGSFSASISQSLSPSESFSPSASFSSSPSPSESASESFSPSASSPPVIFGETCWGHTTDVAETNVRWFTDNWTGTGAIINTPGTDAEALALEAGEYMVSEVVQTNPGQTVQLLQNYYDPGDTVLLRFRTGPSYADCEAAPWVNYTIEFASAGYVQVRVDSTL